MNDTPSPGSKRTPPSGGTPAPSGTPGSEATEADAYSPRFLLKPAVLYFGLSLLLAVFTYDAFNLNSDIYTSSFLALGLNPFSAATSYLPNIGVGGGYALLPYNYLAFAAYSSFAFNLSATAVLLKMLGAVAGFLAAWLVLKIALREGSRHWKAIFYAALFNPYLVFVTAVWGGTEVFVVLLLVAVVFLLRYGWDPTANAPALLLAAVFLALTVFAYYVTVMLVPSFLLYLRGTSRRATFLGVTIVLLLVLALPIALFGLISAGTVAAPGHGAPTTIFSFTAAVGGSLGGQLRAIPNVFFALILVFAVAIPILCRRSGVNLGISLLAVSLVEFSFTFYLNADVFAILAGLIPLSFAFMPKFRTTYLRALVLELFLLPAALVVQMYDGAGSASGIYYWTYFWWHQNATANPALGGLSAARVYLALYYLGAAATVLSLIWLETRHRTSGPAPAPSSPSWEPLPVSPVRRWHVLAAVVVGVVVTAVPTLAALQGAAPTALSLSGQFNAQMFYTTDLSNPGIYPLSGPTTYTVNSGAGVVSFAPQSPAIGFVRNVQLQSSRLDFNATVTPTNSPISMLVFRSNQSVVQFSDLLARPGVNETWTPAHVLVASSRNASVPVIEGSVPVFGMNQSSGIEYVEPASRLANTTQYLGGEVDQFSSGPTFLWRMDVGTGTVETYLTSSSLVLAVNVSAVWSFSAAPRPVEPGQWFIDAFGFGPTNASVFTVVNGEMLTASIPAHAGPSVSVLVGQNDSLGTDGPANGPYGNVTGVYSLPGSRANFTPTFWTTMGLSAAPQLAWVGNSAEINYQGSSNAVTLSVDNSTRTLPNGDATIALGKLSAAPVPLTLDFHQIAFGRSGTGTNLGIIVLTYAVVLPLWLASWSTFFLWKGRWGTTGHDLE